MAAATNFRRSQGLISSPGGLRSLHFDDRDMKFFLYVGNWYLNMNWEFGSENNTMTYRTAVIASEVPPTVTTKAIQFTGSADEGITLYGCAEDAGALQLYMRALSSTTNYNWVLVNNIQRGTYSYDWKQSGRANNRPESIANYDISSLGESHYSRLRDPGIVRMQGFPKGSYQFRFVKLPNASSVNDGGNKALYFDGAVVTTRHRYFH